MSRTPRLDLFAVVAAVLALTMLVAYLWIMGQEGDQPVVWFLSALVVGATAAGYGAHPGSPHRSAALLLAGFTLAVIGVLAILSIGLPLVVAGALCLFTGIRSIRHGSAATPQTP